MYEIGARLPLVVKRGDKTLTLQVEVREVVRVEQRLAFDPRATAKAGRIRSGILRGTLDR